MSLSGLLLFKSFIQTYPNRMMRFASEVSNKLDTMQVPKGVYLDYYLFYPQGTKMTDELPEDVT